MYWDSSCGGSLRDRLAGGNPQQEGSYCASPGGGCGWGVQEARTNAQE